MTDGTDDTVRHTNGNSRIRSRAWSFTINNYEKTDPQDLAQLFDSLELKYVFQEEIGEKGTPHLQGFLYSKNPIDFNTVRHFHNKMWCEKAKSWIASKKYCSKLDTRAGKIYANIKINTLKVPEHEWYPWQREIINMIELEPDDRTINWYWEPRGGVGKTQLARYICMTHKDALYLGNGKGADMKHAVAQNPNVKTILIGLPRTVEERINYSAIEEIKDGIFFSGKYESGMTLINHPHIFVFANFPPNEEMMSRDRWNVIRII